MHWITCPLVEIENMRVGKVREEKTMDKVKTYEYCTDDCRPDKAVFKWESLSRFFGKWPSSSCRLLHVKIRGSIELYQQQRMLDRQYVYVHSYVALAPLTP